MVAYCFLCNPCLFKPYIHCTFSVCDNLVDIIISRTQTALNDILQLVMRIQLKAAELATPFHGSIGFLTAVKKTGSHILSAWTGILSPSNDVKEKEGSAAK